MTFRLEKAALYFALLVAWVAMLGSLYFSDMLHFVPCEWCWRQRILMYPLVLILSVGILRKDEELPYYTATISGLGLCASTYHYLLQKTSWFSDACTAGVPCSSAYINWFGFVTIPFLALLAFTLIFFASLVVLTSEHYIWEEEDATPWAMLLSIVAFALVPVALSFLHVAPTESATTDTLVIPPSGQELYSQKCAACHGPEGGGVEGLGTALVGSEFTLNTPEEEWIAFVKEGRPANHPDNTSGIAMPPKGGDPNLTDGELQAIFSFLRLSSKP